MFRIFYGPDTYSRARAVVDLKHELDSDGMLQANTVQFDGTHLDLPTLISTCDTVPFLAAHRLVIVTDLLTQSPPGRARTNRRGPRETQAGPAAALAEYVPQMPATTTLLLIDGELRNKAVLEQWEPLGDVREFPILNERQLLAWLALRAQEIGASFEPRAAALLVGSVRGGDLWTLAAEVEKLGLFAGGRAVTEADVRRLVPAAQDSNVFAMVDAVVAGRLDAALQQLRLLQRDGAVGPYLITMIARQFRQLIIVEDLNASGEPSAVIAKEAGIRSEAIVPRIVQQARRQGATRLLGCYERILEADCSIKRGEVDEDVALELLVIELANGGQSVPAGSLVPARR